MGQGVGQGEKQLASVPGPLGGLGLDTFLGIVLGLGVPRSGMWSLEVPA